jgi:hypothetical protein
MSGNALGYKTKRINKKEFYSLFEEIRPNLCNKFNKVALIKPLLNKESFGDIDILLTNEYNSLLQSFIINTFNPKKYKSNLPIFSIDYKDVQIDLITVPKQSFDFALSYFSYGDIGNLIGRVASSIGFKFGHLGLFYKYYLNKSVYKEILLTSCFKDALEFLGYSYDRYTKGFSEKQEVFDFIISSKFFTINTFLFENLNHDNRVRNKKRVDYSEFVSFLEKNNITSLELPTKEYAFEYADSFFNYISLKNTCNALQFEFDKKSKESKKLNGNIINELTGLNGPKLGDFIYYLKRIMELNDFNICQATNIEIKDFVDKTYLHYCQENKNIGVKQ